jgi:hypothetical protein
LINHERKIVRLKAKILEVKDDLHKLKAELAYLERLKGLAMQEKIRGGGGKCSGKQ